MSEEAVWELQRLLSALCDGALEGAQQTRLEELLQADAECRRLYLEYLDLHARLLVHPGLAAESGTEAPVTVAVRPPRRRLLPLVRYGGVALATLAASLLVQLFWWPASVPEGLVPAGSDIETTASAYVATLTQSADGLWQDGRESWRAGSRLLAGELKLHRGLARIQFDSGPALVIEGPAHLHLESSKAATVWQGKVVFRTDETAPPFHLHTPSGTLVDFGTEYAVAVGPEGEEVHVFDGEVERTPKPAAGQGPPEYLKAGQARRYRAPATAGQPTVLEPERFVRRLAEPPAADRARGLLAYEGFDYREAELFATGQAAGGLGWASPWTVLFVRPLNAGDRNQVVLDVREGLSRPAAAQPVLGGCFAYAGFTKAYRRLATPVRLDTDGVYYLSFLFRRYGPPLEDPVNAVAVLLWTDEDFHQQKDDRRQRLNIGVGGSNELFTHLQGAGSRTPLPLRYGETYLLAAKIVASKARPDQVFMRVYGPDEPIEREEPGSWSVVGPPLDSDLVFDWLQLHINSKSRQMLDELRLGSSWAAVTAPWIGSDGKKNKKTQEH
jgi:hypothetical protein